MNATQRVVTMLRALVEPQHGAAVHDLAADSGVSVASATRILHDLRAQGFARQTSDGRWAPGAEFLRLALIAGWRDGILAQARPIMRDLVKRCGESAVLTELELDTGTLAFIAVEESEQAFQYEFELGALRPLHTGASGHAVIAFLPDGQREALISHGLAAFTERTITDAAELREQLAAVRERGFARSYGERVRSAVGTAAPVRLADGTIYGSLLVTVPEERFDRSRGNELGLEVRAAAQRLSQALGYEPDQTTATVA